MRLEKRVVKAGDSKTFPAIGDVVEVEYTCWLYNANKQGGRGKEYVEATIDRVRALSEAGLTAHAIMEPSSMSLVRLLKLAAIAAVIQG